MRPTSVSLSLPACTPGGLIYGCPPSWARRCRPPAPRGRPNHSLPGVARRARLAVWCPLQDDRNWMVTRLDDVRERPHITAVTALMPIVRAWVADWPRWSRSQFSPRWTRHAARTDKSVCTGTGSVGAHTGLPWALHGKPRASVCCRVAMKTRIPTYLESRCGGRRAQHSYRSLLTAHARRLARRYASGCCCNCTGCVEPRFTVARFAVTDDCARLDVANVAA